MRETVRPVTQREYEIPADATLMSATDEHSHIRYANAAFVATSGFSAQELQGEPHKLVRHPDMPAQAFADLWATLRSGQAWTGLVKNRRSDGDHYWVRANVSPVRRQGRPSRLRWAISALGWAGTVQPPNGPAAWPRAWPRMLGRPVIWWRRWRRP